MYYDWRVYWSKFGGGWGRTSYIVFKQDTQLKCLLQCKNQESIESSSIPSIPIDTHCENNDEQTDMSCSSSPSNSQSISTSRAVTSQDDAIQCDKIESTTSSYDRLSLPSETSSYDRLSLLPAPVDVASEEFDQVRSKPEREGTLDCLLH